MMKNIKEKRAGFDGLGANNAFSPDTRIVPEIIADVPCIRLTSENMKYKNSIAVYLHGGIFTLGSFKSHGSWASHLTTSLAMEVVFVEYRLAPETPYPGAPQDILSVINTLLGAEPELNLFLVGDSAGGGLVATILPEISKKGSDYLKGCILLSPFVDLTCSLPSYDTHASLDPKLPREALYENSMLYVGATPMEEVNPANRLEMFHPPTLIMVGSNEVLLDDSKLVYETVRKNQEACTPRIFEGQSHVWVMDDITAPEAVDALTEISAFVSEQLAGTE